MTKIMSDAPTNNQTEEDPENNTEETIKVFILPIHGFTSRLLPQSLLEMPLEPVVLLSQTALENAYYVCHNVQVGSGANFLLDLDLYSRILCTTVASRTNHLIKERKERNLCENE